MKTTNPTLSSRVLSQITRPGAIYHGEPMTVEGAINRTAFLLFLLAVPAAWIWTQVLRTQALDTTGPWILGGIVGGLVAAIATVVKKDWAPITAPIYAACEGLAIGGLSAFFELQ
ncbi:MAG TPA: Bax inhibitor-1/YccA family protein, partial [Gemmatimonadales bacterium]|nr:Bax inhibitor-1/YccA family protein [Gemmatimonadales bacterium]